MPNRVASYVVILISALAGLGLYLGLNPSDAGSARIHFHFDRLFDLDGEGTIPAWLQSTGLFAAAALTAGIGYSTRRDAFYWKALAAGFLLMSADEATQLHEWSGLGLHNKMPIDWITFGIPLVGVLGILFFRFWQRLDPHPKFYLALAGAVYLGGAVGLEVVANFILMAREQGSGVYVAVMVAEETMEMTGIAILLGTLHTHALSVRAPKHVQEDLTPV